MRLSRYPSHAVHQTLRVTDADISRSVEKDSLVYDGNVIPFLTLNTALGRKTCPAKTEIRSAVVLEASAGLAAIGVDRLLRATSIVTRPLPPLAPSDAVVAAVPSTRKVIHRSSSIPKGSSQACLDGSPSCETAAPHRASVLVIDDSLTTRMLNKTFLSLRAIT